MKINVKKLGYFLLIIPFFVPVYFIETTNISKFVQISKVISSLFILVKFIMNIRKVNKVFFSVLILLTLIFIVGLLNNYFSMDILQAIILCMLFEYGLKDKRNNFLIAINILLEILIYSNFLSIILFPDGMYVTGTYTQNWLLGYKNPMIRMLIPACTISMILSYNRYKCITKRSYFLLLISIITVIIVNSSTGVVGMSIFIGANLLYRNEIVRRIFSLKKAFFTCLIISYLIINQIITEFFAFFIEGILNKSLNFTGRDVVWERAKEFIYNHKFIGIGDYLGEVMEPILLAPHPHNYFLHILIQGGIIGFILLLNVIFTADKSIRRTKNNLSKYIVSSGIISFYIMGITESLTAALLMYPMYILLGNINYICDS